MKKISIQGNKGSYSHIAAAHIFGEDIELLERDTFKEVFEDTSSEVGDFGVIPIENSTHGSVFENYDHLTNNNLYIVDELYLKINFHLIGTSDSEIGDITDLHTHRVSLSQIKNFLNENPQIKGHIHVDNGAAVAMITEKSDKTQAAAASKLAAKIYGGKILKETIQDNPKNYTRFVVIGREEDYSKNSNKTTIQFEVEHESGTLAKTLNVFASNNISLSKIESRPILNTNWEYRFYVDLVAGLKEEKMQKALEEVKPTTRNMRILGTYRNGEYIDT